MAPQEENSQTVAMPPQGHLPVKGSLSTAPQIHTTQKALAYFPEVSKRDTPDMNSKNTSPQTSNVSLMVPKEELQKLIEEYEAVPVEGTFHKNLPSWETFAGFVKESLWFRASLVSCLGIVLYYSDIFNPTASFVLDSHAVMLPSVPTQIIGSSYEGVTFPKQTFIPLKEQSSVFVEEGHFKIEAIKQARYTLTGKVMSTQHFDKLPGGAWENQILPTDVTIAWGQLAYATPQQEVRYWQENRSFFFTSNHRALSKDYILTHASNTHIMPASDNLRKAFKDLHIGDVVAMEGFLVNVKPLHKQDIIEGVNDWWPTSMFRDDTGAWASETMYVTQLKIGQKLYK